MGTIFSGNRLSRIVFIVSVLLATVSPAAGRTELMEAPAEMGDYCQVPPFIGVTKPNLLLVIDNSASMFDLQYIDRGKKLCIPSGEVCFTNADCPNKVCSVSGAACVTDSGCDTGQLCTPTETCGTTVRTPIYCYDNTYTSTTKYEGYFDRTYTDPATQVTVPQYYEYDLVNGYFNPTLVFSCAAAAADKPNKLIANQLCAEIDTSTGGAVLVRFVASGNYLNWLTASKFDIEKGILTGGKYDASISSLLAQSRGCVGRKFIKEALLGDFNDQDVITDLNNPPLGLSFGVRGPVNATSPFSVSKGGQTYIDLFLGDYNAGKCETAINDYNTLNPQADKQQFINDIAACIGYSASNKNTCQFDQLTTCANDAECGYFAAAAGSCNVASNGTCGGFGGGVCAATTPGVCTADNGTCTGAWSVCSGKDTKPCNSHVECSSKGWGYCIRTCVGGGKAGATCNSNNGNADCSLSTCTAGKPAGTSCMANSDCDVKSCTNAGLKHGSACSVSPDCDVGKCTSGKDASTECLVNADCNVAVGHCTAPAAAAGEICAQDGGVGRCCSTDAECTITGKGHCLPPSTTQVKSTYAQSMHSCLQFLADTDIGQNEVTQVTNPAGCNQVYAQVKTCSGGANDGRSCAVAADCPAGACLGGPGSIRPGSPVSLCSSAYAGYCATTNDNWVNTIWIAREFPTADECVKAKYREYCGAVQAPPVPDPTDDPSNTAKYDNLPAILSDMGLEGQLGPPFAGLTVQVRRNSAPTGLVQEFASMIRIGAMGFDFNGSVYECGTRTFDGTAWKTTGRYTYCSNDDASTGCVDDTGCTAPGRCVPAVQCPYVCKFDATKQCSVLPDGSTLDCPGTGPCVVSSAAALGDPNKDGAKILDSSYILPSPQKILTTPNGGHSVAGIVNSIDGLEATTWTPFSEALYNVIGYFRLRRNADRTEDTAWNLTNVMRLNASDFNISPVPSENNCQKNNVLLITDGQATADLSKPVTDVIAGNIAAGRFDYAPTFDPDFENACLKYAGSRNVDDIAWIGQHRMISDFTKEPVYDKDRIRTYTVYTGTGELTQADCLAKSEADLAVLPECIDNTDNLMCKTARYGKGNYYLAQDPEALKQSLKNAFLEIAAKATSGTAASVLASGEGSGANLVQALFYPRRTFAFNTETLWAGSLQNLWYFVDPFFANSNIREDTDPNKVLDLKKDNVVELFFNNASTVNRVQVKRFVDNDGDGSPDAAASPPIIEIETLKSLWESGRSLWSQDPATRKIYVNCDLDDKNNCLADAALNNTGVMELSTANFDTDTKRAYLRPDGADAAARAADAANIINFTRGTDLAGLRQRAVAIDLNSNSSEDAGERRVWKLGDVLNSTPKIASWMPLNTYNRVYGDSTYGLPFQELNPSDGDNETTFLTSRTTYPHYRNRGMVFAGANDGMLHAFRLGTLQLQWSGDEPTTDPAPAKGTTEHARLLRTCSKSNVVCDDSNAAARCPGDTCPQLGEEMWAFIPKHALPYLKYMSSDQYCHVYTIDLTPFIFDASIERPDHPLDAATCPAGKYWNCTRTKESWRTILIGGMRYGGACKAKVCSISKAKCDDTHPCGVGAGTCQNSSTDTIGTPLLDPGAPSKGLGYSSYFALDVTESLEDASKPPRLLWEFSHEDLGLSSSAPAVVRIKALSNPILALSAANLPETAPGSRNGRWFVVFGSGPTGPISDSQQMGKSNQRLKLFVLDLKDGPDSLTGQPAAIIDTNIDNAFAGSMLNSTFDSNLDYQDDVVYFGYVKKCTAIVQDPEQCKLDTWTDGGVGRLLTSTKTGGVLNDALYPTNWKFSNVIEDIGAVTSSVVKLQNNKTNTLWLYFGSGRYIYKTSTDADDNATQRTLFGVKDNCFSGNAAPAGPFLETCPAVVTRVKLNDATDAANALAQDDVSVKGWLVDLDKEITNAVDAAKSLGTERVITDPLATSSGLVFFTTFAPYSEVCTLGGKSYVWALKYDTAEPPGAMLKGKALVQVSTGSIEQVDMSKKFTEKGKENEDGEYVGRRTAAMEGVPPTAQGLAIISSPPPVKRVLHMKER